jgi:hypothetical protein
MDDGWVERVMDVACYLCSTRAARLRVVKIGEREFEDFFSVYLLRI